MGYLKKAFSVLLAFTFIVGAFSACGQKPSDGDYSVERLSAVMYALEDAEVRSGPGDSYEAVGRLNQGEEVTVTGVSDNGWYRIKFKEGEYFVNKSYVGEANSAAEKTSWITTWSTAVMPPDGDDKIPSDPVIAGNTVRQQIRVSAGGEKLRLVISNEYGETGLVIESLRIAPLKDPSSHEIDASKEKILTFSGDETFTVAAGKSVTTDEADFEFEPLSDIAITIKFGSVPKTLTCHTASRCYAWVTEGNHVSDNDFEKTQRMVSWYFIQRLETEAAEDRYTIVTLGDSLTDGASIADNSFARYSDELARLIESDENLAGCGVAAMGIGATSFYTFNAPIDGSKRVERDVIGVAGAKYLILMMGTNDIGYAFNDVSDGLIAGYKELLEKCHENGIKVIGMTIPPNKGSGHYSAEKEKMRKKVNEFILSDGSGFDGVIDISSVMASKDDPEKMDQKYLSTWNDWLHFNADGYTEIGSTVYEYLKEFVKEN